MRKLFTSIISIALLFTMLVLSTGCGVKINGKEYEFFSLGESEKSSTIGATGSEASKEFTTSVDRENAEKLVLDNNSGNIKIKKSENSQIKIEADKKVRGASQSDKNIVLENMNIALERDGKDIKIVVETKDRRDFWDWLKEDYKAFQVTINYTILIPEGITSVDVNTGAGNVDVKDLSAELKIDTGAGNIDIDRFIGIGSNELSTGAGNISFDGNVYDIESFKASTGAGNIAFEVPEDSRMSLKANTGIGILTGSFIKKNSSIKLSFDEDINGGGPKVELSSGVGNIDVDNN